MCREKRGGDGCCSFTFEDSMPRGFGIEGSTMKSFPKLSTNILYQIVLVIVLPVKIGFRYAGNINVV